MSAMRFFFISFIFMLLAGASLAQSSKKKKKDDAQRSAPTTLDPSYQQKQAEPKKVKKKSSDGPTYESEQAYYDRMARLFKEKRKAEKEMEKPQYSNPMYFGHKRPPKKHKPGKMKFCKECGLRH
jgi:hypothetical protein